MKNDNSVVPLRQPDSVEDALKEIARERARRMLATALETEIEAFVGQSAEERLPDGRQRIVRHGYGPQRKIQSGIGGLQVRRPNARDCAADPEGSEEARIII